MATSWQTVANNGKNMAKQLAKPWQGHGKTMARLWQTMTKPWQNHGRTMGNHGKTTAEQCQNHGKTMTKPWQNHDKTLAKPWHNNGKTMAKQNTLSARRMPDGAKPFFGVPLGAPHFSIQVGKFGCSWRKIKKTCFLWQGTREPNILRLTITIS